MTKKPLPTIGVDKYTFFEVESDTASGIVYGDPVHLKGLVEISPTDAGGSDILTPITVRTRPRAT